MQERGKGKRDREEKRSQEERREEGEPGGNYGGKETRTREKKEGGKERGLVGGRGSRKLRKKKKRKREKKEQKERREQWSEKGRYRKRDKRQEICLEKGEGELKMEGKRGEREDWWRDTGGRSSGRNKSQTIGLYGARMRTERLEHSGRGGRSDGDEELRAKGYGRRNVVWIVG